jgi:hypothetical protein
MGQHKFSSQNGGNLWTFVLPLLMIGLLIGPAWGPTSGATSGLTPKPTSEAILEGQASLPPGGLGLVPSSPDKQRLVRMPEGLASIAELPSSVDLTQSSVLLGSQPSYQGIPPVGDQGQTNTCTGWAASYYYKTYQEWLERGWQLRNGVPHYDHIFSPSFVYNQITANPDPNCDDGAMIPDALELIVSAGDLPSSQFPFNPLNCNIQPTPAQKTAAEEYSGATDTSYGAFFAEEGPPTGPEHNYDLLPLKQRLANNDPFVLGFPVYSEFDNYQCFQVVGPPANPDTYRDLHAVTVVGYDDSWAGVGGFKIVNSWGPDWGCYGYAWLSYDFVRMYAWEAWWMEDNWAPWIDPHVPDHLTLNIGETIVMDLTPYEHDREDSGPDLKWYVEGADHCTVVGQGSANDVLLFQPSPVGYTGYDEITLILRDSREAEDRQQLMLGWFNPDTRSHLPLALRY